MLGAGVEDEAPSKQFAELHGELRTPIQTYAKIAAKRDRQLTANMHHVLCPPSLGDGTTEFCYFLLTKQVSTLPSRGSMHGSLLTVQSSQQTALLAFTTGASQVLVHKLYKGKHMTLTECPQSQQGSFRRWCKSPLNVLDKRRTHQSNGSSPDHYSDR